MNTMTPSFNATSNTSANTDAATTSSAVVTPPPATTPTGTARVAVGFLHNDTDAKLVIASGRIVTGMTGNPAYPSPDPAIADIVTARNSYIAAVNAAKGNAIGIKVRKQQRAALVALLGTLAHYVQVTCNGDLPTLLGSGFTAIRTRQPVGVLPAPTNLRLQRGKLSGQAVARCARLAKAGAYEWQYATAAAPTDWMGLGATISAHTTLVDLTPGAQYIAQVRGVGTAGPSNWSDSASMMVL